MADKIERENHELYGGEVVIEFLPKSHRYHLIKDGKELEKKKRLTGVTSFTGQLDKSTPLMIWATRLYTKTVKELMGEPREDSMFSKDDVESMLQSGELAYTEAKEKAAGIGDYVHEFAEQYSIDKNEERAYDRTIEKLGEPTEEMKVAIDHGCTGFINWLKETKATIVSAEQIVYSRKLGFVGRYDAIIEIDGKRYLTDYKTSKNVYPEHYYQASGYFGAWEEEHSEKLDGALIVAIAKEDIENKSGTVIKKAGDVTAEIRSREDCLLDYKVFEALTVVKERQKVNVKWGK